MQTTWFTRFWKKITELAPASGSIDISRLAKLDPDHIELENVRSLLGVSAPAARQICETAVRRGVFRKRVQVLCPNNAIALTADEIAQLPETVRCREEIEGHLEVLQVPVSELRKVHFYCLNDGPQ